jgi:hypothetical protein
MPLFAKNGKTILFVHIPKTAGSTVESLLGAHASMTFMSRIAPSDLKVCPQHLTIQDLKEILGDDYWSWSFSIIRDPYAKLESEYCFRNDIGDQRFSPQANFSAWVLKCLVKTKKKAHFWDNHFRPQTNFLDLDVSVFRYEDGVEFPLLQAAKKLGMKEELMLEHRNASNRRPLEWSRSAIEEVNEFYSDDFKQLGYKMRTTGLFFFKGSTN